MENIKFSKLYNKAKNNNKDLFDKPKLKHKIIKKSIFSSTPSKKDRNDNIEDSHQILHENTKEYESTKDSKLILPKIIPNQHLSLKEIQNQKNSSKFNSSNLNLNTKIKLNNKKFCKNFFREKEFLKQNILQSIQVYLDPKSLFNFLLTSKKFYYSVINNDELFFNLYIKRFKTKKTNYLDHRGKWKEFFIKNITQVHKTNYDSLKTKFLKKSSKNSYQMKKDVYYLTNNLFLHIKPVYSLEIDGKQYKLKYILSDKILSHVNFFANFDENFLELDKVKILKLFLSEKNLGLFNINLVTYEFKKRKFTEFKSDSKFCKIFYDNEFIISTFEKKFLFFLNISLPICKICECCFDFLKGMHDKNLKYFDDANSKFGLFDYSILINIKSWNNIFFTVNVNTLDFKDGVEFLYYVNDGKSKILEFIL